MRKILTLILLIGAFYSCKSSKRSKNSTSSKVITKKSKQKTISLTSNEVIPIEDKIINYAKSFEGVRYKWGGTSKSGMDCSGLIFESFNAHNIYLPRISRDIAKKGTKINLKNTQKGDLLFFKTGKNRRNAINHVGLIVEVNNKDITFIHATTKAGVITSSLSESYWLKSFFEARRIL